ncbi:MAG TPA: ABC transporter substrate-binding protein [Bryobacteraceae bacterium]|nr:ABC transporter substrate-binding protein [Bryobacteraceae bacterium]
MRHTACRLVALGSFLALLSIAADRPRYGGTLRLAMTDARAKEILSPLVFERLVDFHGGQAKATLAVSWVHNTPRTRWRFRLRPDVRFHDGTPVSAEAVAGSLASGKNDWRAFTSGGDIIIQASRPIPGLLWELAESRPPVVVRNPDGAEKGTGPFRISEWQEGSRAVLTANNGHWAGRPFVDTITVELGRSSRDPVLDLELGRTDVAEVDPAEARRASERGLRVWSSAPLELWALRFEAGRSAGANDALREAVAFAIDRPAIHAVLLQKRGEPAGGILPQWISGYAHLFPSGRDIERARRAAASTPAALRSIVLVHGADPMERAVAERIALNAREAGISVRTTGSGTADLRLVRVRITSVQAGGALGSIADALRIPDFEPLPATASLDAIFRAEQALVEQRVVIPLFHLPELYATSPEVKVWTTPPVSRDGTLRLDSVWLARERP